MALEHLRRGNPRGARGLLRKLLAHTAALPPWVEGVGVGPWGEALSDFFAAIDIDDRVAAWAAGRRRAELPPEETWPLPPLDPEVRRSLAPPGEGSGARNPRRLRSL